MFKEFNTAVDDAESRLYRNYNSCERLPALLEMSDNMETGDWLVLLGRLWSGFDNIGVHCTDILWAIGERVWDLESVIPEMMSSEERTAFEALPEQVTIYRGCGPTNMFGFSWSLDRQVAASFPFMPRYWADEPKLLTAMISKSRAAALKLTRHEQEIILFDDPDAPSIPWNVEPLERPSPGWAGNPLASVALNY